MSVGGSRSIVTGCAGWEMWGVEGRGWEGVCSDGGVEREATGGVAWESEGGECIVGRSDGVEDSGAIGGGCRTFDHVPKE